MNTAIYTRVSTSVQDYQRQIDELQQFASSRGWNVLQVFSEKVSGAKKNEERQELQSLLTGQSVNTIQKCKKLIAKPFATSSFRNLEE